LSTEGDRAEQIHYEHKLQMDTEKAATEEAKCRHDSEVALVSDLKQRKEGEQAELKGALDQIERDFLAKTDY